MEKIGQIFRTSALGLFSLVAVGTVNVCFTSYALAEGNNDGRFAQSEDRPWTYWLGAGGLFLEGGQANESGGLYEGRVGYKLDPNWEIEYGIGGSPLLDGKIFPAPSDREATFDSKNSPGETWMIKSNLGALYHLDADTDRNKDGVWDPYLSLIGGAGYFNKWDNDSKWSPFGGPGMGVSYWFNKDFALRLDYNVVAARDEQKEVAINHHVLLMAYYNFGGDNSTSGMAKGNNSNSGNSDLGAKSSMGLNTVYFDFDKSDIKKESKQKLDSNFDWMKKNPSKKISLEGHTDERGTNEYNLALGQRRAKAAFDYMRALGASSDVMSITSFGEETPEDPGHNESAWSKNRRVETISK